MVTSIQENLDKAVLAKEQAESKLELKRKALKEIESNSHRQITGQERELAILKEKYENLQTNKDETIGQLQEKIYMLEDQVNDQQNIHENEMLLTEIERLKYDF